MKLLKYRLDDMLKLATARGFELLSPIYYGIRVKHLWKCRHGHIWSATPNAIKNGTGCPTCSHHKLRRCLNEILGLGEDRGFKLLSEEFIGTKKKHLWQCGNGHVWTASPSAIKAGTGCPMCQSKKKEQMVRFVFESLFNKSFPKNRTILGCRLEIDGYNDELKLGFEYNGEQHYKKHFWNKGNIEDQRNRDKRKRQKCRELGIDLIEIPYDVTDIETAIRLLTTKYKPKGSVDWSRYKTDKPQRQKLLDVAKKKDGELLSPVYLGSHAKHEWRCGKCGTRWWAKAKDVVGKGSWCPTCAHNRKLSVQQIKKLAQDSGLRFISEEYLGMNVRHDFLCLKCGSNWSARPNNIRAGHKCPYCPKGGDAKNAI